MHLLLSLLAALSSPNVPAKDCQIEDAHFYLSADVEKFPATLTSEIDYAESEEMAKRGEIYFEARIDRCSRKVTSLLKMKSGKPIYGFYYEYKDGNLVSLKMRYIDGQPTVFENLSRI